MGVTAGFSGFSLAGASSAAPAHGAPHGAAARQVALGSYLRTHSSNLLINKNAIVKNGSTAAVNAPTNTHSSDDSDLLGQQAQWDFERTAPAGYVTGPALASAAQQASRLRHTDGSWQQFTSQPYNAQPADYTDPFWGNEGAGFALVGGRVTALVTAPDGAWFAGTADGGVWRSYDQGQHWKPVFDKMPTLSIGALAVDPANGSVWAGTGEANESQDSYQGTGVYATFNDGRSWFPVGTGWDGVSPLASHTTFRLAFDSRGNAYAATNNGLFRYSSRSRSWTEVLDPAGPADFPPYDQQVTDVAIVPGTNDQDVIAAIGWHGPGNTENNGFYESTDGGHTFAKVTPTGQINASDIGRTTFAYSADGSKLYAIVQSPAAQAAGASSVLQGIFVATGSGGNAASVTGPWTLAANAATLFADGSGEGEGSAGVQAWYNQDLAVDPSNPDHVYAGLEEVYESTDGGGTWVTASPYWNYAFACDATNPPTCPNTTHPDQHALMVSDGKIVEGNDGGVYSRPLSDTQQYGDWTDLNATLHDLQFYDARAGLLADGSTAVVGGLQDNGSAFDTTTSSQMVEPAGGDGFDVIVDPANANNWVGEYVDGTMYTTTDGGHSFSDFISPTCVGQEITGVTPRANCDPGARFVTPIVPDQQKADTWLIGGEDVWVTTNGWNTTCTDTSCDWSPVYDTGAGNAITALSSANNASVIYAAWTGGGGNPGPAFNRGIATNYGGTWHQVNMTGLPNRYIAGVTVDPSNPAHAYAIFNGYSRRFVPGGGVGHVFETWDGGQTWTDISGNLPDIASDALVLDGHHLALATDDGVYTAREGHGSGTRWERLGTGLPNVVVDDLTVGPHGYIYAGTHGRGVWRIRF